MGPRLGARPAAPGDVATVVPDLLTAFGASRGSAMELDGRADGWRPRQGLRIDGLCDKKEDPESKVLDLAHQSCGVDGHARAHGPPSMACRRGWRWTPSRLPRFAGMLPVLAGARMRALIGAVSRETCGRCVHARRRSCNVRHLRRRLPVTTSSPDRCASRAKILASGLCSVGATRGFGAPTGSATSWAHWEHRARDSDRE